MSPRQRLGLISVVALLSLAFLVTLAPIGGVVGAALFVVVLFLVGLLFFRFNPHGDVWDEAQQLGIKPWLYVLVVLALGLAFFIVRLALVDAA